MMLALELERKANTSFETFKKSTEIAIESYITTNTSRRLGFSIGSYTAFRTLHAKLKDVPGPSGVAAMQKLSLAIADTTNYGTLLPHLVKAYIAGGKHRKLALSKPLISIFEKLLNCKNIQNKHLPSLCKSVTYSSVDLDSILTQLQSKTNAWCEGNFKRLTGKASENKAKHAESRRNALCLLGMMATTPLSAAAVTRHASR